MLCDKRTAPGSIERCEVAQRVKPHFGSTQFRCRVAAGCCHVAVNCPATSYDLWLDMHKTSDGCTVDRWTIMKTP